MASTGDVFEFPTPSGLRYLQLTDVHPEYGPLVRVVQGEFAARPDNLAEIVARPDGLIAFVTLPNAIADGEVELVGREEVPEAKRALPRFKSGRKGGRTWVWEDGKYRAPRAAEVYEAYPALGIRNFAAVLEALGCPAAAAKPTSGTLAFFLSFPSHEQAVAACDELTGHGDIDMTEHADWWSVRLALDPSQIDREDRRLNRIARRHGGDLDGHEIS